MSIYSRLVGLETEYAFRYEASPWEESTEPPSRLALFREVVRALRLEVLTAAARSMKEGVFAVNGGAVWFESPHDSPAAGLIEGATPECRGARQAVLYQRAQDRLLSRCAEQAAAPGRLSLLKNDRDADGNIYGAQENYEACLGGPFSLWGWRLGLAAAAPLIVVVGLLVALAIGAALLYFLLAAIACALLRPAMEGPAHRRLTRVLLGGLMNDDSEELPTWAARAIHFYLQMALAPLAIWVWILSWLFVFRRTRRELLPFLISRGAVAGVGTLDKRGRFHLADKAPGINCLLGFGSYIRDYPIFSNGHLLKVIAFRCWRAPREFAWLMQPRQRLQICLGDGNMCDDAELLRVGTTLLVIDAIEGGWLPRTPRFRKPLRELRLLMSDPELNVQAQSTDGRRWNAVALQRFYLEACRRMVEGTPEAPDEAREILELWSEVLDRLENAPASLIGRLDWVTKKFLLDQMDDDSVREAGGFDECRPEAPSTSEAVSTAGGLSYAARKKADLKYHELSSEGYFQRLRAAGLVRSRFSDDELSAACQEPPADTPAALRSRYMREFGEEGYEVRVDWLAVVVGSGRRARVFRLRDSASC